MNPTTCRMCGQSGRVMCEQNTNVCLDCDHDFCATGRKQSAPGAEVGDGSPAAAPLNESNRSGQLRMKTPPMINKADKLNTSDSPKVPESSPSGVDASASAPASTEAVAGQHSAVALAQDLQRLAKWFGYRGGFLSREALPMIGLSREPSFYLNIGAIEPATCGRYLEGWKPGRMLHEIVNP